MRHQLKIKKLGRTSAHRAATLAAMSTALIEHKRIKTTLAKAKALRGYVEPIITRGLEDTTHNRRQAFRRLRNKHAVTELFTEVAPRIGEDRKGGYTRIIKLGQREGDNAEMAVIELVDYNDVKPEGASGSKRSRRTRRGGGGGRTRKPKAAATQPKAKQAEAAETAAADDLTKVYGIGKVFSAALADAGITTFAQLAEADLDTLRGAIAEGSDSSEEAANEETWARQASFLANGDTDGFEAYLEEVKAEGMSVSEDTADAPEPVEEPAAEAETADAPDADASETPAEEATQEAEAVASDSANPDATGNPQIPMQGDHPDHPDAEQGATPGTGEPNPEAQAENQGRSADNR